MKKESLEKTVAKIAVEVSKPTESIRGLVTKSEFDTGMDSVARGQDAMITILNRLDQERVFTFEAVKRVEGEVGRIRKDVDRQDKEIGRIKEVLHVQ